MAASDIYARYHFGEVFPTLSGEICFLYMTELTGMILTTQYLSFGEEYQTQQY